MLGIGWETTLKIILIIKFNHFYYKLANIVSWHIYKLLFLAYVVNDLLLTQLPKSTLVWHAELECVEEHSSGLEAFK